MSGQSGTNSTSTKSSPQLHPNAEIHHEIIYSETNIRQFDDIYIWIPVDITTNDPALLKTNIEPTLNSNDRSVPCQ
jgi:hypothetical protein